MRNSSRRASSLPASLKLGMVICLLLPLVAVTTAVAQDDELRSRLRQEFELLPLRDGLALRPIEPDLGIVTIELIGDDLVVDGVSISLDELEARLGRSAAPFRALLALAEEDRRAWIEQGSGEADIRFEPAVEALPGDDTDLERAEADRQAAADRRTDAQRRADVRRKIERARSRSDAQVVIASPLTVEEDEVSRDVVVLGGVLTVKGRVVGDAAAIGGSAWVSGEIDGDLSVVGGSVTLEDGAEISGDVISVGGEVTRADGAVVDGQVLEVPFGPAVRIGDWDWRDAWDWNWSWDSDHDSWRKNRHDWFSFSPLGYMFGIGWDVMGLAILALLACLVLLLAPGPVEKVRRRAASEPWMSGLVGLLSQILFVPVLVLVCLVLVISVIGIPLLILVPFALLGLLLVAFLGYAAVAVAVGSWLGRRFGWNLATPYVALLVGFVAIQGFSFIGELFNVGPLWFFSMMFGVLGALVCYVAWTVGFGAAILTRFGTARDWHDDAGWTPPEAPPSYAQTAPASAAEIPELPPDVADWVDETAGEPEQPEESEDPPERPEER